MSVIERFNLKVGDFQLFESPVEKHGTHDQKTHGNWATGGASGVSNDELKRAYQDFQGLSEETGYSAVYSYTHNGYEILNTYLRTDSFSNDLMEDAKGRFPALLVDAAEIDEMDNQRVQMRGILNATTSALDTAIDEAPQVLEDKIVFRVVSVDALKDLKEGGCFYRERICKHYLGRFTERFQITREFRTD
jgi:exonuclease III